MFPMESASSLVFIMGDLPGTELGTGRLNCAFFSYSFVPNGTSVIYLAKTAIFI
jgi:hypothetical protein